MIRESASVLLYMYIASFVLLFSFSAFSVEFIHLKCQQFIPEEEVLCVPKFEHFESRVQG
jgi:hypothetical protein